MARRVLAIMVLLAFASAVFAQEAAYKIVLHRPVKAGQKYRLDAQAKTEQGQTAKMGDQVVGEEKAAFSVELVSEVTVLEVSPVGKSKKELHKVVKCTRTEGSETKTLLEEGTELLASAAGMSTTFTVEGAPVSAEAAEALNSVLSLTGDETTDDEAFGTKEAVKVGDSWPVNSALIAQKFSETQGIAVKVEDVKGAITLRSVGEHAGVNCLDLSGEFTIKVAPPLPPSLTVEKGEMRTKVSGFFPVDTELQRVEETTEGTMEVVAKGKAAPEAPEMTLVMRMSKSNHARYSQLK